MHRGFGCCVLPERQNSVSLEVDRFLRPDGSWASDCLVGFRIPHEILDGCAVGMEKGLVFGEVDAEFALFEELLSVHADRIGEHLRFAHSPHAHVAELPHGDVLVGRKVSRGLEKRLLG